MYPPVSDHRSSGRCDVQRLVHLQVTSRLSQITLPLVMWPCQRHRLQRGKTGQGDPGEESTLHEHPSNYRTLTLCCFKAGPPSETVAQHSNSTGLTCRVCWDITLDLLCGGPLVGCHSKINSYVTLTRLTDMPPLTSFWCHYQTKWHATLNLILMSLSDILTCHPQPHSDVILRLTHMPPLTSLPY